MTFPSRSSGPRGNVYSGSKFTNWTRYDPWFAEARSAFKRFVDRIPDQQDEAHVLAIPPLAPQFRHACSREYVEHRLRLMPHDHTAGLKAVLLLAGTRKQERSWGSSLACYGIYWRRCIFLCAHPWNLNGHYIDTIRDFYLDVVLMHEVAHHVDRMRTADQDTKEGYAHAFVERKGA